MDRGGGGGWVGIGGWWWGFGGGVKKWTMEPGISHFSLFSRAHLLKFNHFEDFKVFVLISWVLTELTYTEHL